MTFLVVYCFLNLVDNFYSSINREKMLSKELLKHRPYGNEKVLVVDFI